MGRLFTLAAGGWAAARRVVQLVLALAAWGFLAAGLSLILVRDAAVATDTAARVRAFSRPIEFDFVDWTGRALSAKLSQASLGEQGYLPGDERTARVRAYFSLAADLRQVEAAIAARYADPAVADPAAATADLRQQRAGLRRRLDDLQPLAEAALQEQLSVILAEQGLAPGGQPFPPVAFRTTPLPYALVVSPRAAIRQEAHLDVSGDLTLEEQVALEERVARALDVSTLVVPLGGIGTYPTMVAESGDLSWVASVVAHEWVHNYLTLRPLGLLYDRQPELRTMNETAATIAGNELGVLVLQRYYPDLAPAAPPFLNRLEHDRAAAAETAAPAFDFRAEMRATRVRVDELLAEGKVAEAEAYMEARRRVFWDNGYQLRKLNQAYFAFHGAYADGAGAPGADPVGPAVRLLRRRSPSLAHFLNTLAWFTSYQDLESFLIPYAPDFRFSLPVLRKDSRQTGCGAGVVLFGAGAGPVLRKDSRQTGCGALRSNAPHPVCRYFSSPTRR